MPTVTTLIGQTLRVLDLPDGTHVGETNLYDNTGQTYSTFDALLQYLNDGAADMARTCLPLRATATVSDFAGGMVLYSGLADGSSNRIFAPEGNGVRIDDTLITRGTKHWADTMQGTGTTQHPFRCWYPVGGQGLFVVTNPALSAGTLSVYGLAIPAPMTNSGSALSDDWLLPEHAEAVVLYAAARLCEKNASDTILGPKVPYLWERYAQKKQDILASVGAAERALLLAFGDGAPTPQGG